MTTALATPLTHVEEPPAARVDIDDHLERLGLQSHTQYRLWCHRQGFSTSLEKTPAQAQGELDRSDDAHQPSQSTERRRQLIERIAAADFDPVLRKVADTKRRVKKDITELSVTPSLQFDILSRRCDLLLFIFDHLMKRLDTSAGAREKGMIRAARALDGNTNGNTNGSTRGCTQGNTHSTRTGTRCASIRKRRRL